MVRAPSIRATTSAGSGIGLRVDDAEELSHLGRVEDPRGAQHRRRDRALGLQDTSLSPATTRLVGLAATSVSFAEASEWMGELAGGAVDPKQVKRTAEALGREVAADERERVEPAPTAAATMYMGLDGTGVPVRKSEVKGRCGKQPDGSAKTREVKLATMWTAETRTADGLPERDPAVPTGGGVNGFARATSARRRPARLWPRLAGCVAGSMAGPAAVPGRLEASVSTPAARVARGDLGDHTVDGAARVPEGRGELGDVGRQTSRPDRRRRGRGGRSGGEEPPKRRPRRPRGNPGEEPAGVFPARWGLGWAPIGEQDVVDARVHSRDLRGQVAPHAVHLHRHDSPDANQDADPGQHGCENVCAHGLSILHPKSNGFERR